MTGKTSLTSGKTTTMRPPMSNVKYGQIHEDGIPIGVAPPHWSKPRRAAVVSRPGPPLTEAQQREQRRQDKAAEGKLVERRAAARREREERQHAIEELQHRPVSDAVKQHLLKQLTRPEV